MAFDLIIRHGTLVDGTGRPARLADVGIEGDRITAVGDLGSADAARVLEAAGLVVSPGFIDAHTHSDLTLLVNGRAESKIRQGVTTEVTGNCGISPFPVRPTPAARPTIADHFELGNALQTVAWDWSDLDGYARKLDASGISLNVAPLVGHSAVRIAAMGAGGGAPTSDQLRHMQRLTDESMEQGAFGLSVGLTLVPSSFADTDELVALGSVLARHGRLYVQHSRLWAGWHARTIREALDVGRQSGCRVQISHQAIVDSREYGTAPGLVAIMEEGRGEGIDVMYDVYPYLAGGTGLDQLVPTWVLDGGTERMLERLEDPVVRRKAVVDTDRGWFRGLPFDWSRLLLTEVGREDSHRYLGWSLQQLAKEWSMPGAEVAIELIRRERNRVGVVMFNRDEDDMRYFLQHPLAMIGSDGSSIAPYGPFADTKPHPRFYGTFPRVLGRYVRDNRVLSLESAVYKMTGMVAERFGLRDRGTIAPDTMADVVVFHPETIVDEATFDSPHRYSRGVQHVLVAGQAVIADAEHTGARPGRVLRAR